MTPPIVYHRKCVTMSRQVDGVPFALVQLYLKIEPFVGILKTARLRKKCVMMSRNMDESNSKLAGTLGRKHLRAIHGEAALCVYSSSRDRVSRDCW